MNMSDKMSFPIVSVKVVVAETYSFEIECACADDFLLVGEYLKHAEVKHSRMVQARAAEYKRRATFLEDED
jgi:hypothetical protein